MARSEMVYRFMLNDIYKTPINLRLGIYTLARQKIRNRIFVNHKMFRAAGQTDNDCLF